MALLRRKKTTPAKPKAASEPARVTPEEKWATYARALIITAHPDDAEFMAGGTIAKMCAMGWEVTLCIATSGDKGTRDPHLRPQELAALREAEQRAAAKVLGLSRCIFLGYGDGFLAETEELREQVVRLIRTLQPDLVLTWDGFRAGFNHTDHRVIGRVVRDALYPAAHDPLYYADQIREGLTPHRTAELLMAGAEGADFHVDIGPYLAKKADAVLCHTSQIDGRSRNAMLKAWREGAKRNERRRKETGYEFAESFKRIEFRRNAPPARTDAARAAAVQRRAR